jgi:hypothetical protein
MAMYEESAIEGRGESGSPDPSGAVVRLVSR